MSDSTKNSRRDSSRNCSRNFRRNCSKNSRMNFGSCLGRILIGIPERIPTEIPGKKHWKLKKILERKESENEFPE